ncbi:MAG: hemin ABC transporter substrate-binding protein [Labilithrix sp.]|nr:hemin ABC transporter substrate-binding protein [Labilithrix sp.]
MRVRSLHMFLALLAVAVAVLSACDRAPVKPREDTPAEARIVSVGSAVTETLFALGAGDAVVGVDTSSLFPDAATKLPKVGYQRTLAAEGILSLRPTLVLVSDEAGPPAVLEQLRSAGVRLEIVGAELTVDGVKARVHRIAEVVGRDPSKVLAELDADLTRARVEREKSTTHPKVLVLYARGGGTLQVFGRNTTAETMVRLAGGENAVTGFDGTKPLTPEALAAAAPDVIVIPSRGLESLGGVDALLKVPGVATTPAGKTKRIVPIDDLLLLGFGPRTGKAALELGAKLRADGEGK